MAIGDQSAPLPPTRGLPATFRKVAQDAPPPVRIVVGVVVSAPDASSVRVTVAGSTITVPRLASFTSPTAGRSVYLLAAGGLTLALGTVNP